MDLEMEAKALTLVKHIMDNSTSTAAVIKEVPQKTSFRATVPLSPLPRTMPEAQGMEASYLASYLKALHNEPTTFPQTVTIVRNGAIISQTEFFPYKADIWHITHSLCKSVTGLAIGLLVDDKKLTLETKLSDVFGDTMPKLTLPAVKNLTLRQILTMSSGITFNEAGTVTETDWVKSYFESIPHFTPGTQFSYNSMNTFMLSAIVERITGKTLCAFINERLFSKMGIVDYYWEKSPMGIAKGGMGMYILPEDMTKVGMLYLQKGKWNGEQLISEYWTTEATKAQITVPDNIGVYDYGYQVWVRKGKNYFAMNGMFGQNVLVFPDNDLLVSITAGNNDMFQENPFFSISEEFFGKPLPAGKLPANPRADKALRTFEMALSEKPVSDSRWHREFSAREYKAAFSYLNGRIYDMDPAEGVSIGVLPLITQALQNNYTRGTKRIGFTVSKDGRLNVTFTEADETHVLPIGFTDAAYTELSFHNEPYAAAVSGTFAINEDDMLVLKLLVGFTEIPNARTIKIVFTDDVCITTQWNENPGQAFLFNGIDSALRPVADRKIVQSLADKIKTAYPAQVMRQTFERTLTGTLVK